jgi:hypothetical protein
VFDAYAFYSDEPRRLDDTAVCAKVRDAVNAAVTDVLLNRLVDQLNIATGGELRDDTCPSSRLLQDGHAVRASSDQASRTSIAATHWMRVTKNESVTRVRYRDRDCCGILRFNRKVNGLSIPR